LSHIYHSYPQYGYTELVNQNGDWCTLEDEKGEIVTTGFTNPVMPLIRYRTDDIAVNTITPCQCNRQWKLIKRVEGRTQDYVIGAGGQIISLTALIYAQHFTAFRKIKNMQLIQEEAGKVLVRVVVHESLGAEDKSEITAKMEEAADGDLEVAVQEVAEIPRTERGKYRFLIQKLETRFGPPPGD
jgi:phenylacetate-CoA ligase